MLAEAAALPSPAELWKAEGTLGNSPELREGGRLKELKAVMEERVFVMCDHEQESSKSRCQLHTQWDFSDG